MQTLLVTLGILIALTGAVAYVLWFMRLTADWKREQDLVFLQILMPKKESKEDKEIEGEQFASAKTFKDVLGITDHLYQTLSSLRIDSIERFWKGSHFFSLEYAALAGEILTFIAAPRKIVPIIEKQITSYYPDAIIDPVEDYNIFTKNSVTKTCALLANKSFVYPFKT